MLKWMNCCFESEMDAKLLLDVLFPIPLNEKIESREEWEPGLGGGSSFQDKRTRLQYGAEEIRKRAEEGILL